MSGWLIIGGCFYVLAILFALGSFKVARRSDDDAARKLAESKERDGDAWGIRTVHDRPNTDEGHHDHA